MSGALALRADQSWWDERQQAALAQMGVAEAPAGDQAVFLHVCQRTGLDPFAKQIHLIGRWDGRAQATRYTIQVGIDGLRVIAQRTGLYQGRLGPWWCGPDGEWRDVWLGDGPPFAARVGAVRSDHGQPTYAVALYHEYVQSGKEGRPVALWASKPAHMLAKVAEALALRAAFPQDMGGLYTDDEMPPTAAPSAERPMGTQEHAVQGSIQPAGDRPTGRDWAALTDAFTALEAVDGKAYSTGEKLEILAGILGLEHLAKLADLDKQQVADAVAGLDRALAAARDAADVVDAELVPEEDGS